MADSEPFDNVEQLDLDALQAIADAAVGGKWQQCLAPGCVCGLVWSLDQDLVVAEVSKDAIDAVWSDNQVRANVAFIAASRQAVPALIDECRHLRRNYESACMLVADMHAAAVGEMRGPDVGPVEDVAKLRAENEALLHVTRALQAERGVIIESIGLPVDLDGCAETLVPAVQRIVAERDALRAKVESLKAELARLVLAREGE